MLLDRIIDNGHAQACPLTDLFSRKKRIKYPLLHLGRHARAVVFYRYKDMVQFRYRPDGQGAARLAGELLIDRVKPICNNVKEYLVQLSRIILNLRKLSVFSDYLRPLPDYAVQYHQRGLQPLINICILQGITV